MSGDNLVRILYVWRQFGKDFMSGDNLVRILCVWRQFGKDFMCLETIW